MDSEKQENRVSPRNNLRKKIYQGGPRKENISELVKKKLKRKTYALIGQKQEKLSA